MFDIKSIKAIGFDVDGTLYQISDEMSITVNRNVIDMAAAKLKRDPDDFQEEYLGVRDRLRSNTLALNSYGLDGEGIFQKVIDEFPMEKFIGRDRKLIEVIATLKRKYRLFIITNGSGLQVERKLECVGLNKDDFDPRIYSYDQGWVKPQPEPYLAALEALQMPPEETVYIGDREDTDLETAKALGMKTIYVRGQSALADAAYDSVYDILQVL